MAESIGILMPNWVGDVVMATPAIRALKEQWPKAHLVGIVRPYVQDVLAGLPWFDELLPVNRLGKSPLELWNLAGELRRRNVDTFLSLRRSLPAFALARLSMARQRVGYGAGIFTWMLTASVRPPKDKKGKIAWSTCELYRQVVEAAGCMMQSNRLELATTATDEAAADDVWNELRLPVASSVVVLNAGSATSSARVWPEEHYAELARSMVKELNAEVLIHCGPKERDAAASLATRVGLPEVKSLSEITDLPIGLSKAVLRRRLLVTSDSGPRHIAAAFQTPTVVLAGPLDPAANGNGNPYESAIWTKPECAPCNQSHCPLKHHRCMRDLHVEQVLQAVKRAWRYKGIAVAA